MQFRPSSSVSRCPGPAGAARKHFSRREFLRTGLTGFSALTLGDLYRVRALAGSPSTGPRTAVILVWLRGGASHLETFDPKPQAPSDFRGPYKAISTNVPGIHIGELLPRLATIADKYAILRSIAHTGGGHPAGTLQVLSGDPDGADKLHPTLPDWMSVAHFLRSDRMGTLPNYVAINPVDRYDNFTIAGPGYLGPSHEPFKVTGDPNQPNFEIPGLHMNEGGSRERLRQRTDLKDHLDVIRSEIDRTGAMEAFDSFHAQALNLLTSPQARDAFDLSKEPDHVRDRYGRNQWGQQCLMARRLVEAGVEIIATEFDGPLCGRVGNWDDHPVNHHVFDALKFRLPFFDQAVSALIEDIYGRGLDRRVLVVVAGEFGRTPRISYLASSGAGEASGPQGTVQPGRDHWPNANSMIFAGGGIQTGQVIGATDARGEEPIERRVGTGDFLATIYKHLEIDIDHTRLITREGRPAPLLSHGKPIRELARTVS